MSSLTNPGRRMVLKIWSLSSAALLARPALGADREGDPASEEYLVAWIRPREGGGMHASFARRFGQEWRPMGRTLEIPSARAVPRRAARAVPSHTEREEATQQVRQALAAHAAAEWQLPVADCSVHGGRIVALRAGREARYRIWLRV